MADELVILFVGAQQDASLLAQWLTSAGVPAHMTRVTTWRAFSSVSSGWDVIVAGGPVAPAGVHDVLDGVRALDDTPVLAVTDEPRAEADDAALAHRVTWFTSAESSRMVPVLRAITRAAVAEGHRRQSEHRADLLERQLRQVGRLHAVGQMAAGVAHEFNNVLTVISGYAEQLHPLLRGQEPLERLLQPIQQAGRRGAELSQRLLTFSRTQAPSEGDASVTAVVREAAAMLMPLLGEKVSLRTFLDQSLPRVRGQAGSLIEVITNLAVNARDAMPDGGTLTIETRRVADAGGGVDAVALVVRDTGAGMDEATLERACEPFFTTKNQGAGTGLGLALVRDIIEQCGGTLNIASTAGVGTEVTIVLPGVRADESEAEAVPETAAPGGFETVLVVEDDAAVREIVTQFLRGAAYYVLEARDSDEALATVRRDPRVIDLLVTDIVLPGQSGPELAGVLREFAPHMRTLFISGYPSDAVGGSRPAAFLAKPFSRAAFLQAVRRALTAPRHRDIHSRDETGRLTDRERDAAEGPTRRQPH